MSQGKLVVGFMDALHIPSATLVGHSMGGVVMEYAALEAPAKVDSLILVSPGFYGKGAPSFVRYLFFPLDRIMARQFYKRECGPRASTVRFIINHSSPMNSLTATCFPQKLQTPSMRLNG